MKSSISALTVETRAYPEFHQTCDSGVAGVHIKLQKATLNSHSTAAELSRFCGMPQSQKKNCKQNNFC